MAKKSWKEHRQERKDADKWFAGKYLEKGYNKVSELFKGTDEDDTTGTQYGAKTQSTSYSKGINNQQVSREPFLSEFGLDDLNLNFQSQFGEGSLGILGSDLMPINPPGQAPNPIIDFLYSPMMKGLVDKYDAGQNYGAGGLLGQAIFNKVTPDSMSLNLEGDIPNISYSPNEGSTYSAGPSHREGDKFSGIQLSGKWEF